MFLKFYTFVSQKKFMGKKNKTSIKSIFESPDYPKVKNDRSSK